jgi:hypothetical protein
MGLENTPKGYKHGGKGTRLYRIWVGMKRRCYGNHHESKNYKEHGITLCDEWKDDFAAFRSWSQLHGYSDELTIDRINNNKGYSPDNCRWVDMKTQQNNRRNNYTISIDGVEYSVIEFAKKNNIKENSVRTVLYRNKSSIPRVIVNEGKRGEHICLICTKDMFQLKKRNV